MKLPNFGTLSNPNQFDFRANWKLISPFLNRPLVQGALNWGMREYVTQRNMELEQMGSPERISWSAGDPPWKLGNGVGCRYAPRRKSLDWYRPWGLCHWVAPFAEEIAKCIYPGYEWTIFEGKHHTVVVDLDFSLVFDLLLFDRMTAKESLFFAVDDSETDEEQELINLQAEEHHLAQLLENQRHNSFRKDITLRMETIKLEINKLDVKMKRKPVTNEKCLIIPKS